MATDKLRTSMMAGHVFQIILSLTLYLYQSDMPLSMIAAEH